MACYSYKDVVYGIPEKYTTEFIKERGVEPDGDPNYNGDDWILTGMWIRDLESKIKELEEENLLLSNGSK